MVRGIYTILLLILTTIFMTMAWYGHLKFREMNWFQNRDFSHKSCYRIFIFNFIGLFYL